MSHPHARPDLIQVTEAAQAGGIVAGGNREACVDGASIVSAEKVCASIPLSLSILINPVLYLFARIRRQFPDYAV